MVILEDTLESRVMALLANVPDPEIPVISLTDLGIIRAVRPDAVVITPTYSGCPATLAITGRAKLLAYGIAPPEDAAGRLAKRDSAPATCPQCGSANTSEISRFGSTPCKALWRCTDCAEPFDRFKCI